MRNSFRILDDQEIAFVSGGNDEVVGDPIVVTGTRLRSNFGSGPFSSGDVGNFDFFNLGGDPIPDYVLTFDLSTVFDEDGNVVQGYDEENNAIVVTATPEQIQAAQTAFNQAQIDVAALSAIAIGFGTAATYGSAAGGGVFASSSFLAGISYNQLVEIRAEELYANDIRDGVWDGRNSNILPF